MTGVSESSIWTVLLPVVVGGLIALVGGAVGPVISHILSDMHAKTAKRESNFERLITAAFDHDHWLGEKRSIVAYGQDKDLRPDPFPKLLSVAMVHFPELMLPVRDLSVGAQIYQRWMTSAAVERTNNRVATINDGFAEAYDSYIASFTRFQMAAQMVADKLRSI